MGGDEVKARFPGVPDAAEVIDGVGMVHEKGDAADYLLFVVLGFLVEGVEE